MPIRRIASAVGRAAKRVAVGAARLPYKAATTPIRYIRERRKYSRSPRAEYARELRRVATRQELLRHLGLRPPTRKERREMRRRELEELREEREERRAEIMRRRIERLEERKRRRVEKIRQRINGLEKQKQRLQEYITNMENRLEHMKLVQAKLESRAKTIGKVTSIPKALLWDIPGAGVKAGVEVLETVPFVGTAVKVGKKAVQLTWDVAAWPFRRFGYTGRAKAYEAAIKNYEEKLTIRKNNIEKRISAIDRRIEQYNKQLQRIIGEAPQSEQRQGEEGQTNQANNQE